MTYRRFVREMDCQELGDQIAFDIIATEPAPQEAEETLRAELAQTALAGLKARKAARPR